MFFGRKKSPSVKIPSNILKREAAKMAKQIIKKENEKEKKKLAREKLREKAKTKARKIKNINDLHEEHWDNFFSDGMQKELLIGGWGFITIIFLIFLFSPAEVPLLVNDYLSSILGQSKWQLPFISLSFVFTFFRARQTLFPFGRIVASLVLFAILSGFFAMFAEKNQAFEIASNYGGSLGFAITFFPREFLGDILAWVILLILGWFAFVFAFQLRLIDLFNLFSSSPEDEKPIIKQRAVSSKKNISQENPSPEEVDEINHRFQNKVEIINSSKSDEKVKKPTKPPLTKKAISKDLPRGKSKLIKKDWQPPTLDLLVDTVAKITVDEEALRNQAEIIRQKLEQFGLDVIMRSVHVGPTVTQFTLEPLAGVKLNKITSLKSDLALSLAAKSIRIEAPIRGQKLVGIEIPNQDRALVGLKEVLTADNWQKDDSNLKLALGRNITGKPVFMQLDKAPHLLVAGKTGSGKSVAMNAFLISLLWQNSPENLRLILIDPKQVELKPYDNLPHLLTPVITRPEKSVSALAWAVAEMNRRYQLMSENGVRNLSELNTKFSQEKKLDEHGHRLVEPNIVIVIDELADLMMVAGKDVEAAICRIAQMARAVGIHLIVATQRPSVDVVTGLIKANLPARISFRVNSGIDSRTIIDGIGAEDLLGFGDMLSLDGNSGDLTRIQGLFLSNEEISRIVNHIKIQYPEMIANDEITEQSIDGMAKGGVLTAGIKDDEDLDAKYEEAVNLVIETGKASASFLQRHLEMGYARAARLLDQMEKRGVIGPSKGAKARDVYGRQ